MGISLGHPYSKEYLTPESPNIYVKPYRDFAECTCKEFQAGDRFSVRLAIVICGGNHDSVKKWLDDMEGHEVCEDGRTLQKKCEIHRYYFD